MNTCSFPPPAAYPSFRDVRKDLCTPSSARQLRQARSLEIMLCLVHHPEGLSYLRAVPGGSLLLHRCTVFSVDICSEAKGSSTTEYLGHGECQGIRFGYQEGCLPRGWWRREGRRGNRKKMVRFHSGFSMTEAELTEIGLSPLLRLWTFGRVNSGRRIYILIPHVSLGDDIGITVTSGIPQRFRQHTRPQFPGGFDEGWNRCEGKIWKALGIKITVILTEDVSCLR